MTAAGRISLVQTSCQSKMEHLQRQVDQEETSAHVSVTPVIWSRRERHWIMAMVQACLIACQAVLTAIGVCRHCKTRASAQRTSSAVVHCPCASGAWQLRTQDSGTNQSCVQAWREQSKLVSLAVALPGHDIMIGIHNMMIGI